MSGQDDDPEWALLSAAWRGEPRATADLTRIVGDVAWTACVRLSRARPETETVFREIMEVISADRFARLKAFDSRARVRIYIALVVRDLLAERVVRGIALNAEKGWRAFQAFFDDDMRRIIARLLPGTQHYQNREDAYQAVCEALVVNDLQRLRAYSGRGSPAGYVLHVIENLVIDYVRTIIPRRRLPAAVQRLPELDQAVFRLIYWEQLPPDPLLLIGRLPRGDVDLAEVVAAVVRVRRAVPMGYQAKRSAETQMVDISTADQAGPAAGAQALAVATPEDQLMEGQERLLLERALAALQAAFPRLTATERLYLECALAGHPAREIARMNGLPVEAVHRLAQQVKRRLAQEIGEVEAVKNWKLSV